MNETSCSLRCFAWELLIADNTVLRRAIQSICVSHCVAIPMRTLALLGFRQKLANVACFGADCLSGSRGRLGAVFLTGCARDRRNVQDAQEGTGDAWGACSC